MAFSYGNQSTTLLVEVFLYRGIMVKDAAEIFENFKEVRFDDFFYDTFSHKKY